MNSRTLMLVVGLAVLAAAGLGWMQFSESDQPAGNLSGASVGGPFTLIDQDGKSINDKAFAGHYRLMYFGYTFCPDVCPTDVAVIAKGLKAYEISRPERAAKVVPIFVTVDPERDNPAALKAFVTAFHPRLVGLTGTPAQIGPVLKAFGIYARKVPGSDPQNYLVDHFAVNYLFGPDGRPIAFLPHGATAADMTAMLETYVR